MTALVACPSGVAPTQYAVPRAKEWSLDRTSQYVAETMAAKNGGWLVVAGSELSALMRQRPMRRWGRCRLSFALGRPT